MTDSCHANVPIVPFAIQDRTEEIQLRTQVQEQQNQIRQQATQIAELMQIQKLMFAQLNRVLPNSNSQIQYLPLATPSTQSPQLQLPPGSPQAVLEQTQQHGIHSVSSLLSFPPLPQDLAGDNNPLGSPNAELFEAWGDPVMRDSNLL